MNQKELEKQIAEKSREQQLESIKANKTRAQSITIGTAGGGAVEIIMRSGSGKFLWNTYQPVEVMELINQLSAGIGCHIQIVPRQDFGSWRDWKMSPEELEYARGMQPFQGVGHAPHPKYELEKLRSAVELPRLGEQPGTPLDKIKEEETNVATKKIVNKRITKRSRAASK